MRRSPVVALTALSLAAFAFVTTETVPIGLLPQIADSLKTSIPLTGALVTTYAFTVALSALPATALTARLTRRSLLLLLLATLLVTNIAAALASSYVMLFGVRVLNAIAHGVFWSIAGSCAVRLVPPRRRGFALAMVFGGVSLATVGGVPIATFIGQHAGWHTAFAAVAATATVVMAIIALTIDDDATATTQPGAALTMLRQGRFAAVLATTVLVVLGQFVAYTYIVPYVVNVDRFPADAAAPLLLLFGLTGAVGNVAAGAIANRSASAASLLMTALIAASLLALCWSADSRVVAIVALAMWGFGAGGLAVGLQTRVLALVPQTPELASALFAGSFNIGIGGGALLGAIVVGTFGVARTPAVGAGLALIALIVQALAVRSSRKRRQAGVRAACH